MEKLVYLIGKRNDQTVEALRDELLGPTATALAASGAVALTVNVADLDEIPGGVQIADPEGWLSACVSLWLPSLDQRGPIEKRLDGLGARMAGYLVTESVPRDYERRDWPDGARSPGVTLVAAFPKPAQLDDETFYRNWHESHTPLALEVHPLTRYIRNSVVRPLTPGAPPFRGIVEERVKELREMADPLLFYGSEEGQRRAVEDFLSFADLEAMHSMVMSEYILLSAKR